jgi:Na+/H+ antiporter NhaC
MTTSTGQSDGRALLPFAVFLLFYLGLSLWSGDFYAVPMPTAFIAASAAALAMGRGSLEEKIEVYAKGMGENNIMLMALIFILAGAFAAVAKSSGAVDSAVLIARYLIPDRFFAGGLFLVSCFISLAIGTSCGTIAALTPIAVGLAQSSGIGLPLMLGAVVGGAMFGDNLSMISDTTIAATRTQETGMKEKFRVNIRIAVPAALAVLLIYFFTSGSGGTVPSPAPLSWRDFLLVLPYGAILVCALCGVNVMFLLLCGTLAALIIGVCCGSFAPLAAVGIAGKGTLNMAETLIVALLAGGLLGTIRHNGGLNYLISRIGKNIKSSGGCELGCACLVVLINLFTANNTVAIVVAGPVARELSLRYGCDNKRIAAILDTASCVAQGIIPYGAQILIALGVARSSGVTVPVNQLIGSLYYPMLLAAALLVFIFRGAFTRKETQRKA